MTPEEYWQQEFETYQRRWEADDYTALMELVAITQANGLPLPEWAVQPLCESLDWTFKNRKEGKRAPFKEVRARYRRWRRYISLIEALDDRKWGISGQRPEVWREALKVASESLVGTEWHATPKTVEADYILVKADLDAGRTHLYPF